MADTLPNVITKLLLPSKRPSLLPRPHLVDFIHAHIERKLILISAGAGYGKTSLLIEFGHDTDLPVCWLSLDEGDRDLAAFLSYLVAAIQQRFPAFGRHMRPLLRNASSALDITAAVGALTTDIYQDIPDYFVLILDDYHFLDESEVVNRFLDELLRHLPENCHILLSSRTLPKLTMTRLVALQEIAGLGVADLRFSAQEIQELLRRNHDIQLSDEEAASLAQKCEGWITGVILSTHDLWSGMFKDVLRVQGDESQVFDYLASEVFARQPRPWQDFLLRSSVLNQMTPALCDDLLGVSNSAETLATLERQNLFTVHLEGDRYRYHHLFQAFLRAKERERNPEQYAALHVKAGHLFADQGNWNEAIEHYLVAEAWEEAAQAMQVTVDTVWERGQWATLARWIDTLPPALLAKRPLLAYFRGKVYGEIGAFDKAMDLLERARTGFAQQGDQIGIAKALVAEGIFLQQIGDIARTVEYSQRALSLLGGEQSDTVGRAYRALGLVHIVKGEFAAAITELQQALTLFERFDRSYDIAVVQHDLGVAYERSGNLAVAELHFKQALKHWERTSNVADMANTLNSLGVGHHYQGRYAEALATLEEALEKAVAAGAPRTEAYVLASLGDLYRDLRDFPQALAAYERALEIARRRGMAFIGFYALLAMGDTHRLQGDLAVAHYYIEQAAAKVRPEQSRYEYGLYKLSLGILLCQQGRLADSVRALSEAAEILQADGAKRDLARAHLYLAQVALSDGHAQEVEHHLQAVADLAAELGYWQFVVAEGQSLAPLARFGAREKIGGSFYRQISAEIRALSCLSVANLRKLPVSEDTPGLKTLEIYALGPARVVRDGQPITNAQWEATTTKELFFLLLSQPRGLSKEQIIEALWDEISPSKGNSRFHSTVHRLRRALYRDCIVREGNVYRLALEDVHYTYDVAEFDRYVAEGRLNRQRVEECFRGAMELYQGDYLTDIYSMWAEPERARLQREYIHILTELSAYYAEHGRYEASIELGHRVLAVDSYREETYRQIMQCYALAGNRSAALKCYEKCARTLREELGVEPALETVALYQQILKGLWDRPRA